MRRFLCGLLRVATSTSTKLAGSRQAKKAPAEQVPRHLQVETLLFAVKRLVVELGVMSRMGLRVCPLAQCTKLFAEGGT